MMMKRRQTSLPHLGERKQNNRGSSLALVISVMAIIGLMGTILLTVSLMNYRMKEVNLHSQKNFYSAENVMDEIRAGLGGDISTAVGEAYRKTLEQYGKYDETGRKTIYVSTFSSSLISQIGENNLVFTGPTSWHYSIPHLEAMISQEMKDSAKSLTITSTDGLQILNEDTVNGTYTIKNLSVTYVDQNNYMTNITTDIVLSCPPIDYSQKASMPALLSYSMVADDQTEMSGGAIELNGSAYLGMNGADIKTATLTFNPIQAEDRFISGGELYLSAGANLLGAENANVSAGEATGIAELWAAQLRVDSSSAVIGNRLTTYLSDDVVLENSLLTSTSDTSTSVTLNGEVNAFGNPSSAYSSSVFVDDQNFNQLVTDQPSAASSAFLINAKNATLDLSGVTKLMIAGNAYVGASEKDTNNEDVMMGESISLKSDQRAYLVPGKYIGASSQNYGGFNPMTEETYKNLCKDICDKYQNLDVNDVPVEYFIMPKGGSVGELPAELKELGVVGVRREVYPVQTFSGSVPMIYFFLVFENQADAVKYGSDYQEAHQSVLKNRVDASHYNTTITYSNALLNQAPTSFDFYYNGSVLVPSGEDTRFLTGKCVDLDATTSSNLKTEQMGYQEKYAALRHKLIDDYGVLSYAEKNKSVYDNLVKSMISGDPKLTIQPGAQKVFGLKEDGSASSSTAIVVNGDYTWDAAQQSAYPDLHFILASGNVHVNADFEGLIIAGQNVKFGNGNVSLTANSSLAAEALGALNEDGKKAADYLVNGDIYLSGPAGKKDVQSGVISFDDYISYSNWKKQ